MNEPKKLFVGLGCLTSERDSAGVVLDSAVVKASVHESLGSMKAAQVFRNNNAKTIEATYRLELPEGSIVTDFKAVIGKRRIECESRGKDQFNNQYGSNLMQAGLLRDVKNDNIFMIKLGQLDSGQECTVEITVRSLCVARDKYTFKFTVLKCLFQCGHPEASDKDEMDESDEMEESQGSSQSSRSSGRPASQPWQTPRTRVKNEPGKSSYQIEIRIETSQLINRINCPTHKIQKLNNNTILSYDSKKPLSRDLQVDILLNGGLKQHIIASEYCHSSGTQGFMAQVFMLPDGEKIAESEFVFMIDRSQSMTGRPIRYACEALNACVAKIPERSLFNVIGFGDTCQKMFPASVPPNQDSLAAASGFIRGLDADLGGTNILKAMEDVYSMELGEGLHRDRFSRQIFMLTDACYPHNDEVLQFVRKHSGNARVFTIGINSGSNEADVNLIKGLARSTGGAYEFVTIDSNHPLQLKETLEDQLHRAKQVSMTDVKVEWEGDGLRDFIAAPHIPRQMFANEFYRVYAVVNDPVKPAEVYCSIRGMLGSEPVSYEITFDGKDEKNPTTTDSAIQHFAAHEAVRDLKLETSNLHDDEEEHKGEREEEIQSRCEFLGNFFLETEYTDVATIEMDEDDEDSENSGASGLYMPRKGPSTYMPEREDSSDESEARRQSKSPPKRQRSPARRQPSQSSQPSRPPPLDPSQRSQSGRSQSGRSQSRRSQSGRSQSGRSQSGRSQSGRSQSVRKPKRKAPAPQASDKAKGGAAPDGASIFLRVKRVKGGPHITQSLKTVDSPYGTMAHLLEACDPGKGLFYSTEGAFSHGMFGPRAIGDRTCWMTSALALLQGIDLVRERSWSKRHSKFDSSLLKAFIRFSSCWSAFEVDLGPVISKRRRISEAAQAVKRAFYERGYVRGADNSPMNAVSSILNEFQPLFAKSIRRLGGDPLWKILVYEDYKIQGEIPNPFSGPRYLIFLNPAALVVSQKLSVRGYRFHSLISLHRLTYAGTTDMTTHFSVLSFSPCGFFIYDDAWNIGSSGYQGGMLRKELESEIGSFFENVPVFVFEKDMNVWR